MPTVVILLSASAAAYYDVKVRRVPNWLVGVTIAASAVWHAAMSGMPGLGQSVAGLLIGLAVLFPLYLLRGLGAGDVKFFGAAGAAVTLRHIMTILVLAALTLFAMAVLQALRRRRLRQVAVNVFCLPARLVKAKGRGDAVVSIDQPDALLLPFTAAVAIALWLFVLFGRG